MFDLIIVECFGFISINLLIKTREATNVHHLKMYSMGSTVLFIVVFLERFDHDQMRPNETILPPLYFPEIDPSRFKPATGATAGLSFGPEAPNYSELFGDLCPPQPVCEECLPPPPQTHGSGFLYCLNIAQFGNDTYPGYNNRSLGE